MLEIACFDKSHSLQKYFLFVANFPFFVSHMKLMFSYLGALRTGRRSEHGVLAASWPPLLVESKAHTTTNKFAVLSVS